MLFCTDDIVNMLKIMLAQKAKAYTHSTHAQRGVIIISAFNLVLEAGGPCP